MRPTRLNKILFKCNICLAVSLVLGGIYQWQQFGEDSSPSSGGSQPARMEPERRSMFDPSTFSFLPSLKRRCSNVRDWEPTESLADPYVELSSCKNVVPALAHLEHGYYLLGSMTFKNRKRDKVFTFSCSHDSNKFEYDGGRCTDDDASTCSYQKPNEVVNWKFLPKEQAITLARSFEGTNFLKQLLYNDVEGINKEVIYQLDKDRMDALKYEKVTEYLWILRKIQSCKLEGHKPTISLIQEYERLDPKMKSDQSYRDYYAFVTRFGTHVLNKEVSLGGTFFSVNLTSRSGEYVVKAEGGEPDISNLEKWSETLTKEPVVLSNLSHYTPIPIFIERNMKVSSVKLGNFEEIIGHEKIHHMLRQALIGIDILHVNRTFNHFLREALKQELRHICPSFELHLVMSGMGRTGIISCNDHPYWSLDEDQYLVYTIRYNLVRGVCTTRRLYLGACTDPIIVFPRLSDCVRFYRESDCSGKPSTMIGTSFTAAEVEAAILNSKSFIPC